MAARRTIESWASSLRPNNRLPKFPTATRKTMPSTSVTPRRKRSLGRTNLLADMTASPKKTRIAIGKRYSIGKEIKPRVVASNRIKTTPRTVLSRQALSSSQNTVKASTIHCHVGAPRPAEAKARLSNHPMDRNNASQIFNTEEICERLRAVEIQVEKNSQLARNRLRELLDEVDSLVNEEDRMQTLLQQKVDEIWELKEGNAGLSNKLRQKEIEIEKLECRLNNQSNAFEELQKKYQSLEIEFSIARKLADSRATENLSLRNLLDIAQSKTKAVDEKLTSASIENSLMQSKLRRSQARLEDVHNELLQVQGNIQVFARLRPPLNRTGASCALKQREHYVLVDRPPSKATGAKLGQLSFKFDRVLGAEISQSGVFEAVEQLTLSAANGCNVCVFAYGQAGAGKTFTMEGPTPLPPTAEADLELTGIVPRAFGRILEFVAEQTEARPHLHFTLAASFIEIYNETVHDLLDKNKNGSVRLSTGSKRGEIALVDNVQAVPIASASQIAKLVEKAQKQRSVVATKHSEHSSRSHCISQLRITCRDSNTLTERNSILNFVDLAAAECGKESGANATRQTEAKNINFSLTQLLSVYTSLGNKASHVPYRNSKLTHVLSSALDDASKTLMLVHLSPEEEHLAESINSLKIAQKFRELHIEPKLVK